ncbi:MAG TPA: hypothetical protein VFS76_16050 [Pyrinomonadaceae bacterium]|nr:hypothetical protein [Pyrinomonadaceae bacterium]
MAKRKNRSYAKRVFLNSIAEGPPEFIQAIADSSDKGTYKLGTYLLIVAADCQRPTTLEFAVATATARKRSRAKINRFVRVVNEFRDRLITEIDLIETTV